VETTLSNQAFWIMAPRQN